MLPRVPKGFITSEKTPAFKLEVKRSLSEEERTTGFRPCKSITNFPNAVPDFIGPRQFIFLLSVVSVLILTSFFLITFQNPSQKGQDPQYFSFLNQMRQEAQLIQFPSSIWKDAYLENIEVASQETDLGKRFVALSTNFNILSSMYSLAPDPQLREKAQSLGNFVKRAFPNDYSMRQFEVPCLDSACGEVSYSTEEVEILNLAEDAQFKDERSKQELLRKLEKAAFATDSQTKWHYYDSAFRIVISQEDDDPKLKILAQKLLELIKIRFPRSYQEMEQGGLYKLD